MPKFNCFATAGKGHINSTVKFEEESGMYTPAMHGSVRMEKWHGRIDYDKVFKYAMEIYNEFSDIMNNGVTVDYNQEWDRMHPNYIVKNPSDDNDPYNKGYYKICGIVLKKLADKMERKHGYYILLDEKEPATIEGNFSKFWFNVKEFRKI